MVAAVSLKNNGATCVPMTGCDVISLRRMSLRSGYQYLMESIAGGDGAAKASSDLAAYYAASGTPPGIFLGAGLAGLDGGRGVQPGSEVTAENLFNLLGMCADPITGEPLGRPPNRSHRSLSIRVRERVEAIPRTAAGPEWADQAARIEQEERAKTGTLRTPVAGFDLTFSPSKSISSAWALADRPTKAVIYDCHRQAIEVVLAYAERDVFHSRSGTNGVVQEDIDGVVAAAFTHFDSRAGDPQLHDHVVVANRARSTSDGQWRTLDSRGLFKSLVALSELHQGVLADLLTESLGWGWDARKRPHSERLRAEVSGVPEALLAEFSQRSAAIAARTDDLVDTFASTQQRRPSSAEVLDLRRRATLETRPDKAHHSLGELTTGWRQRAKPYVGDSPASWVAGLADRNDLPRLCSSDLADGILADVARVAVETVAERRATFSRANVLAEVHRQLHGVRFVSPAERIEAAERTADLALSQSLLVSAPELHHTPERLRRADGTSRFRAKGHEIYTTQTLLDAEARLLDAGRETVGPRISAGTVAVVTEAKLSGREYILSLDQALAVERMATSGRVLDVLVGPAGTGKSTTMAGLRTAWEHEHGKGSVLGLAPSAAAAEVLASELDLDTENTAKWLHEHRRQGDRLAKVADLRTTIARASTPHERRSLARRQIARLETEIQRWQLRAAQLVIIDEASLASTFALDELVSAAGAAGAKVLLVGDPAQLSAIAAGGMFATLVRDRDGLAPELTDVRRFDEEWEKKASVELRAGFDGAIATYEANGRVSGGDREQMLENLYRAWSEDIQAGKSSLMIAADLGTVSELNTRARADRVARREVAQEGLAVGGGGTAGVGDQVVTRQNERHLATGRRWVRNGDRWSVTATHEDGSMTVERVGRGGGVVVLPADYVREHVELDYASTAHRAQGRTVDTAHTMVAPTTTLEVLYVSATRGRQANHLYVDTFYDPDPATGHEGAAEPVTAKEVLAGVLRHLGADVAAHDMIRREQAEAEGMERLAAEYQTLATVAQTERWDALLARSGLSDAEREEVHRSAAYGPLIAALRESEARGLDIEATLPHLVARRSLADADDVAAVLHGRVDRWNAVVTSRRQSHRNLIAGLVPRAQGLADSDMAQALAERDQAMQHRARTLAEQAIAARHEWVQQLGTTPVDPIRREQWMRAVTTVAAYRDLAQITSQRSIGIDAAVRGVQQREYLARVCGAIGQARALGRTEMENQVTSDVTAPFEPEREIDL